MASIPQTMSGVLIEKTGGVEVLQWKTDLPVPQPAEDEVLVQNEYVGLNYIDTYFRSGLYTADLPLITGKEAAGTVVAVGASAEGGYKPGDKVAYLHEHTYAQYTAVPAWKLVRVPDGMTTQQAAASLLQGLTALCMIRETGGIRQAAGPSQGPWVLVHAAAGGVGTQLVQMLSALGAKVIGTAGGPEKRALAKKNGAEWVIDSREDDLVAKVKEITGGYGADVIFDGIGQATFPADLEIIARKGTMISFGNASGNVPPVNLHTLGVKNIKLARPVVFSYLVTKEERATYTKELFDMILAGKVEVKVHNVYPLQDVAKAHADLEGRKTTGKLVMKL